MQTIDLEYQLWYGCYISKAACHGKTPQNCGKHWGERFITQEKQNMWPGLEHYADVPLFNTKAVVQKTGIAGPTLSAWERRYVILSPERAQNDYRLYSERDIAIIRWLKDRVDEGMSISQAVAVFHHLEQERNQLLQKDSPPPGSASPSRMMLSTAFDREHEPIAGGRKQEEEVQPETDASQPAFQHVQKLDAARMLNNSQATYNMRSVQEGLIEAFNKLDEAAASRLIASMLAIFPVEQVCTELITPTLWEIGRLWEQDLISVSIEHFASAIFHGVLTDLLHATPTSDMSPLVIACCAPGELHELAPLMLSLFLRRAGLRVAYLGQSIEIESLLQTVRQLSPALICVSVSLISFLGAATELGQKLQELSPPRPVCIFGGRAFEQRADLIARVPGFSALFHRLHLHHVLVLSCYPANV